MSVLFKTIFAPLYLHFLLNSCGIYNNVLLMLFLSRLMMQYLILFVVYVLQMFVLKIMSIVDFGVSESSSFWKFLIIVLQFMLIAV